MDLTSITYARIHPAIGVARIGNSDEYFVGPEVPHPTAPPPGGYRDPAGKLKRQAAQFRIYGYDANHQVVGELTAADADIAWTVHVANKKGAWYDFDVALDLTEAADKQSARRNAFVQGADRDRLVIDPGPRSVSGPGQHSAPFDTGQFFGQEVYLGELRTDAAGRLLFLGGKGVSGSPLPGFTLVTFANNPGWHDDTSDGPVMARVTIAGVSVPVDPAWVVTAPPNYSPDLVTPQTMFDVITDALNGSLLQTPAIPSFTRDILPLLRQFNDAQWVNFGFAVQFGWQAPNDFLRPGVLTKLATKPVSSSDDPYAELRRQIFYSFRNPAATTFEPFAWPPLYGDAFGSYDTPPVPKDGFAVTPTLYGYLQQWMNGDFDPDYNPNATVPASLDDVALADRPATLDLAALHFCMGGPFHPGCEMTWPMRASQMYRAPYRLRQNPDGLTNSDYGEFLTQATVTASDGPLSVSGPGDITKWMAVPWQSDTASCRAGYGFEFPADPFIPSFWPSRVPNNVLTEQQYDVLVNPESTPEQKMAAFNTRPYWLRSLQMQSPYVEQITKMITHFGNLGLTLKREIQVEGLPPVIYVETLAEEQKKKMLGAAAAPPDSKVPAVSPEFARARFGGLRRR